jgi:hypothetical protein
MYEGRDLKKEIADLGITALEDVGLGSRESAFAALDAIREHNKQYPEEKLAEMMEAARKEATENMAGRKGVSLLGGRKRGDHRGQFLRIRNSGGIREADAGFGLSVETGLDYVHEGDTPAC